MCESTVKPLEYTEGGLHVIVGECTHICGNIYSITSDEGLSYEIYLNLSDRYESVPPIAYPKVNQRCIIKAEGNKSERLEFDGKVYHGYSEICNIPTDAAHEKHLAEGDNYLIVYT